MTDFDRLENLQQFCSIVMKKLISFDLLHEEALDGPQQLIICLLDDDIISSEGREQRATFAAIDFKDYAEKYKLKGCFIRTTRSKENDGFVIQFCHSYRY